VRLTHLAQLPQQSVKVFFFACEIGFGCAWLG
jgi:hypothetical protein